MLNLTLRDVPADLHLWLKQQAGAHRRSLNQEVILQLGLLRRGTASPSDADQRLARIRAIAVRTAGMPDCFAYALATRRREGLLFKGNDFSQTDVLQA